MYRLSGELTDGEVVVDADDAQVVLLLDGVIISNDNGPALVVAEAEVAVIDLVEGTTSTLTDGSSYADTSDDAPNAAIDSSSDLTITGTGTLTVTGSFNDAIASSDGLVIDGATISVTAADDGIRGKDYLVLRDATITVASGGDALKSDNDEDATAGYIAVSGSTINLVAGGDGFDATTDVIVSDGTITATTGGGHQATIGEDDSAKAIKGDALVVVDDGTLALDAADDGINTNDSVVINGGTWTIASGDDGIHGDLALTITGGTIDITSSVEGLEAEALTIAGGTTSVVASDDGINASDSDATTATSGQESTGNASLTISGGSLTVDAKGDGLDANGSITMTGGDVLVYGPTTDGNGSVDYDGTFGISGGTLVAAGSSGMAQTPSQESTQKSLMASVSGTDGSVVEFRAADGTVVATFTGIRDFGNVLVSNPDIAEGQTYTIVVDGTEQGTTTTDDAVTQGMGGGPGGGQGGPGGGRPGEGTGAPEANR